jgi:hypothetical protein
MKPFLKGTSSNLYVTETLLNVFNDLTQCVFKMVHDTKRYSCAK